MASILGVITTYKSMPEVALTRANFLADHFIMMLVGKGYKPNFDEDRNLSDVKDEIKGNGYERRSLEGQTLKPTPAGLLFSADDVVFEAKNGAFEPSRFVIFDDSVEDKPLVCSGLLDKTNSKIKITDGNVLTIRLSEFGLFSIG